MHLAFDLGNSRWQLAFATTVALAPRLRTVAARDLATLEAEIAAAKTRFGLPPDTPVVTCYEAGRDGFWLHRALTARGLTNVVVDSASIGQNRRARRAKSDRLDATALVRLLLRHHAGERGVWSVLHVPSAEEEDRRHLHRELFTLTRERTRQVNRIKGLLALHGVVLPRLRGLPARPPAVAGADGAPLPDGVTARLAREWTRLRAVQRDLLDLRAERRRLLASDTAAADPLLRMVAQLQALEGVGEVSAWRYAVEFFSWRQFPEPPPDRSTRRADGHATREWGRLTRARHQQGGQRSHPGARHRTGMELGAAAAQERPLALVPDALRRRWGGQRRIGVAVARKLLIASGATCTPASCRKERS